MASFDIMTISSAVGAICSISCGVVRDTAVLGTLVVVVVAVKSLAVAFLLILFPIVRTLYGVMPVRVM